MCASKRAVLSLEKQITKESERKKEREEKKKSEREKERKRVGEPPFLCNPLG